MDESLSETLQPVGDAGPDFLSGISCLPKCTEVDWLSNLSDENSRRIEETNEDDSSFITERLTDYLFTACTRLRLPPEVKYTALLIFDKFMCELARKLHSTVYESDLPNHKKHKEWERIKAIISRQIPLRILSSIQIASKMHSFHDSLSKKTVRQCLTTLGYACTEESVMRSEIRILDTLEWDTEYHSSPVTYVETLLKMRGPDSVKASDAAKYWHYALIILDCVFIHHDEIYVEMLKKVTGQTIVSRDILRRAQADWVLLAASILVVVACCINDIAVADQLALEMEQLCVIPSSDITDLSVAIVECIVERDSVLDLGE